MIFYSCKVRSAWAVPNTHVTSRLLQEGAIMYVLNDELVPSFVISRSNLVFTLILHFFVLIPVLILVRTRSLESYTADCSYVQKINWLKGCLEPGLTLITAHHHDVEVWWKGLMHRLYSSRCPSRINPFRVHEAPWEKMIKGRLPRRSYYE